jgi:hypothetical protein
LRRSIIAPPDQTFGRQPLNAYKPVLSAVFRIGNMVLVAGARRSTEHAADALQ